MPTCRRCRAPLPAGTRGPDCVPCAGERERESTLPEGRVGVVIAYVLLGVGAVIDAVTRRRHG